MYTSVRALLTFLLLSLSGPVFAGPGTGTQAPEPPDWATATSIQWFLMKARIEWSQSKMQGVDYFEIERFCPDQSTPDCVSPAVEQISAQTQPFEFIDQRSLASPPGPVGTYRWEIKACEAGGKCSAPVSTNTIAFNLPTPRDLSSVELLTIDAGAGEYDLHWRTNQELWVDYYEVLLTCPVGVSGCGGVSTHPAGVYEAAQTLAVGGEYEWQVRACNRNAQCSAYLSSGVQTIAETNQSLPGPRNFKGEWLSAGPLEYELTWAPPSSGEAEGYRLVDINTGSIITETQSLNHTILVDDPSEIGEFSYALYGVMPNGQTLTEPAQLSWTVPSGEIATPPTRVGVSTFNTLVDQYRTASSRVGATAGHFRVDEQGNTTYSVGIMTGPSAGSMAPEISLNYNSAAGNGEVGVGWSIGGLSAITRCAQTYEQDGPGAIAGIQFANSDRFCLDGQRLVLVQGSGNYGDPDAEYRLETDPFTKVVSKGVSGIGPSWFKVWRSDGSVTEYGRSASSKIRIESDYDDIAFSVLTWAINQVEDSVGNDIQFEYCSSNNSAANAGCPDNLDGEIGDSYPQVEYHIREIKYGGPAYPNRVVFNWNNSRSDATTAWVKGGRLTSTYLLESISSYGSSQTGNEALLRHYQLTYAPDHAPVDGFGRESLIQIEECADLGATCFPPLRFDWHSSATAFEPGTRPGLPIGDSNGPLTAFPDNFINGQPADLDGDGMQDFVFLHNGDSPRFGYLKVNDTPGGEVLDIRRKLIWQNVPPNVTESTGWHIFDFDEDGRDDLLVVDHVGATRYLKAYRGTDGTTGAFLDLNPVTIAVVGPSSNGNIGSIVFQDTDGDGRRDLLFRDNGVLYIARNVTGAGAYTFSAPEPITFTNDPALWQSIRDRLTDPDTGEVPFFDTESVVAVPSANNPFDYNNDGLADLLVRVNVELFYGDVQRIQRPAIDSQQELDDWLSQRSLSDDEGTYDAWYIAVANRGDSGAGNSFGLSYTVDTRRVAVSRSCEDPPNWPDGTTCHTNFPTSDNIRALDINGDALADLVAFGDNTLNTAMFYWINKGAGFPEESHEVYSRIDGMSYVGHARPLDYDGDGLIDVLYPHPNGSSGNLTETSKWRVLLNSSSGFSEVRDTEAFVRKIDHDAQDVSVFFDANGDGRPDQLLLNRNTDTFLVNDQSHFRRGRNELVAGEYAAPGNLVERFNGSYGDYSFIEYQPLTEATVYERDCITPGTTCGSGGQSWGVGSAVFDIAAPMYVTGSVTSSAPAASTTWTGSDMQIGSVNPDATSRVFYKYRGAKIQGGGRGFLGFREIETTDGHLGVTTTTTYHQDFPRTGRPKSTVKTLAGGAGPVISMAESEWEGQVIPNAGGAIFVYQDETTDWNYNTSGDVISKVVTETRYDENGAWTDASGYPTEVEVSTYGGEHGTQQIEHQKTVNTYDDDFDKWHLGRLTRTEVTTTLEDITTSATRVSTFTYDPTTGMLQSETVEPGHPLSVKKTYGIDGFGNRISETISTPTGGSRSSQTHYDVSGRFVLSTTNALGQTTQTYADHDHFGNPQTSTDMRGVTTTYAYDYMGRSMGSYIPTGAYSVTVHDEQNCSGANATTFRRRTIVGGGPETIVCFDLLGREVLKSTEAFRMAGIDHVIVETEYDALGRRIRSSEPAFLGDTQYWSSTALNELGDPIAVQHPNGSITTVDYQSNNTIVTTDPLLHERKEVRNAQGELRQVEETNNADGANQIAILTFSERFDANGRRVHTAIGADGHAVETVTDRFGNKISVDDPDKGLWRYAYNGFGEMICHVDPTGQGSISTYDALGRMTHRIDGLVDLTNNTCTLNSVGKDQGWAYGNQSGQPDYGLLKSEITCANYPTDCQDNESFFKSYSYDSLGRIESITTSIDASSQMGAFHTFQEFTTYDEYGRVFQVFDAAGILSGVEYEYDAIGVRTKIKDVVTGVVHERVHEMDARGNATLVYFNDDSFYRTRIHDADTGLLRTASGSANTGHSLTFRFDAIGNLEERETITSDGVIEENFTYDDFNRLTLVDLQSPAGNRINEIEYDVAGNITYKKYAGSQLLQDYSYGTVEAGCSIAPGPHAATRVGSKTYCYDEKGNRVSASDGEYISYTEFDKPANIYRSGVGVVEYYYGPDRQRYLRYKDYAGETTFYVGAVEIVVDQSGTWEFRRYVGANTLLTTQDGNQSGYERTVMLKDHLGSVNVFVDGGGVLKQQTSFDAWGLRRDVSDPMVTPLQTVLDQLLAITDRGFGGHEMLDEFGLIHMGGRVYDPVIGRFLQADPFVQAPQNAQNLNRYSYVLNNPLSYTDPTGYFFDSLKKYWRSIASIAIAAFLPWALPSIFGLSTIGGAIATGFVSGVVGSGSLKGGLLGAFSGALFFKIGDIFGHATPKFGSAKHIGKTVAHGVAGGVMNTLQGGKFGHGFASAGVTQAFAGPIKNIGGGARSAMPGRVIASAVVGGSVSALTGGKFANGAITGAFSRAFNDEGGGSEGEEDYFEPTCSPDGTCIDYQWIKVDEMLLPGQDGYVDWHGADSIPELDWVTVSPPVTRWAGLLVADSTAVQAAWETGSYMYHWTNVEQYFQVIDIPGVEYKKIPVPGVPVRYRGYFKARMPGQTLTETRLRFRACLGGECVNLPRY